MRLPYCVKYKTKHRIGLQRYLVSLLRYNPEEVKEEEVLCLFDNQLYLEQRARREKTFFQNFGLELDSLSTILKSSDLRRISSRVIKRLGKRIYSKIPSFLFPLRNFPQMARKFSKSYEFRFEPEGVPNTQLPPKKVIGKGYTDHGTLRDPSYDGSQSWKEISNDLPFLEEQLPTKMELFSELEQIFEPFRQKAKAKVDFLENFKAWVGCLFLWEGRNSFRCAEFLYNNHPVIAKRIERLRELRLEREELEERLKES